MKWYQFIINYWSQIAILIGVAGYVLKVSLDFKFKKKEIFLTAYTKVKLEAISKLLLVFTEVEGKLSTLADFKLTKTDEDFERTHDRETLEALGKKFGGLIRENEFFFSKTEMFELLKIDRDIRNVYWEVAAISADGQSQEDIVIWRNSINTKHKELIQAVSRFIELLQGRFT